MLNLPIYAVIMCMTLVDEYKSVLLKCLYIIYKNWPAWSIFLVISLSGAKADTGLAEEVVFCLQKLMRIDEAKLIKLRDEPQNITPQDLSDISLDGLSVIEVNVLNLSTACM